MRVYKFLNAKYGLEALRKRRLKVARINELNDPFEFLGINLSNPQLRRAFTEVKNELNKNCGLLCFSKRWNNPVLWGHYADSHRGLCLAFDVPNQFLENVRYTRRRPDPQEFLSTNEQEKEKEMKALLCRKFSHWRYEDEARLFVGLDEVDPVTGLYFLEFSESISLKKVLVGLQSNISRHEITTALGRNSGHVERVKTRAAFQTFNVVQNRKKSLWH
jgi:hypothetical protein